MSNCVYHLKIIIWGNPGLFHEKNRDRYEYRDYKVIHDASCVSKTEKEWLFLKSIGCAEQTRICLVRNEKGEDITPDRETFQREGSFLQPASQKDDTEKAAIQVIGLISDIKLCTAEMAKYKRDHWGVENHLHHVLDDAFREDRSPAKGSRNNLALIRKFALNLLRLAQIQLNLELPITELMDLFRDEEDLRRKYLFRPIESFYC